METTTPAQDTTRRVLERSGEDSSCPTKDGIGLGVIKDLRFYKLALFRAQFKDEYRILESFTFQKKALPLLNFISLYANTLGLR